MSIANNDFPIPQQPDPTSVPAPASNAQAVNLIRSKLNSVYGHEPSAEAEEQEITTVGAQSKHQQFIQTLMQSGKSLVEIQKAWHEYYASLPNNEKHEVWQEFYANNAHGTNILHSTPEPRKRKVITPPEHTPFTKPEHTIVNNIDEDKNQASILPNSVFSKPEKTIGHINEISAKKPDYSPKHEVKNPKQAILDKVSAGGKLNKKHHFQSLLFGLGVGSIVIFIFMFGFFNERFIAPFITPSRTASNSPIIMDPNSDSNVGPENKVIIPKINVEVPVVYDVPGISEKDLQSALERGVVHYPQSPVPGQNGNVVVVGHSSNNIFNNGKYKFAFVLLSKLEVGDIFMLNYGGKRYVYKIYSKKIVKPTDVAVLGPADKLATATLITCDPPGTALNRLVILGEQISPTPNNNVAATTTTTNTTAEPETLPGNSESLFHRLFGWMY